MFTKGTSFEINEVIPGRERAAQTKAWSHGIAWKSQGLSRNPMYSTAREETKIPPPVNGMAIITTESLRVCFL